MKKSLVLALVAVLVLSFASMAFAAFTDTTSHWANPYINALVGKNVVSGTTATTFVPDGKVTRAEFAKMIVNAKGLALENPAKATFSDVATTAWFFPYVEAAAKAKYIDGTGNGKFDPTALVTREQIAKMIVLAVGKTADTTKAINFDDKASISDWAKGYVAVAADLKLIEGYNNKFSPKANATRAEAAKLTYNEMRYEGKIEEVIVVSADLMTEVNSDNLVIGGKTYDLAAGAGAVEYLVGNQIVNKDVLKENTTVKFTTNAAGKINRVVVDAPSYPNVKGEVTEVGEDNNDPYVVVAGKKVYVDVDDDEYYSTSIDEDDVVATSTNPGVMPELNKDYLVVYNSAGYAQYAIKLASSANSGILDAKSEDKDGKYIVVDGKKFYFYKDGSTYDVDVLDSVGPVAFNMVTDFNALSTGDRVEFDTNSDNEITALKTSAVDLEGIALTPIYKETVTAGTYDVWLPVVKKVAGNYDFATPVYLHTTSDDAALLDLIDEGDILTPLPGAAPSAINLDTDAKTYINGTKTELYDIKANTFVVVDLNDDATQKATKIADTTKVAIGIVDSIEKSSDKVVSVTINGVKIPYTGETTKYASNTKGKVAVVGASLSETIETGYFAYAVLNASGAIKSFVTLVDGDNIDGVVVGKTGEASKLSKDTDTSKTVLIPKDTVEISYDVAGVSKYAWVTFDDNSAVGGTTVISAKGKTDFASLVKGETVYITGLLNANAFDTTSVELTAGISKVGNVVTISNATPIVININVAGYIFQK